VCLPLLISPCTIKFRSSVLAPAHPGGPRKRAVNGCVCFVCVSQPCIDVFLQDPLVKWLKIQFSELFAAWIHVKALRVYVESVLR